MENTFANLVEEIKKLSPDEKEELFWRKVEIFEVY